MLSRFSKCKKGMKSENTKVAKTNKVKQVHLSKYAVWGSKKSRFIKNQEASGFLSTSGLKAPLSIILVLGEILF